MLQAAALLLLQLEYELTLRVQAGPGLLEEERKEAGGTSCLEDVFLITHDDAVYLLMKCAYVFFFIIIFLSISLMRARHSFQVPAWTLKTQFNCSV